MEWASWFCCVLFLVSLSLCARGNTRRGVETIDYKPIDSAVDKGKGAPCTSHKKPEEFQRDEQNRHLLPFCWLSHRIVCVCVCVCGPRGNKMQAMAESRNRRDLMNSLRMQAWKANGWIFSMDLERFRDFVLRWMGQWMGQ